MSQKIYNKQFSSRIFYYFKNRLSLKPSTRGFIRGNCPCGKGKNTFGYNPKKFRCNCFKCDVSKDPLEIIAMIENLYTENDAIKFIKSLDDVEPLDFGPEEREVKTKKLSLPEGFKLLSIGQSKLAKIAQNYMKNRGFNVNELSFKGIGYGSKGSYFGYLIIPYYYKTNLVYYTARRIIYTGPKFKNPKEEDYGIGKNKVIYNWDSIYLYNQIYIVESITNALTLGDRAIALGGKKVSPTQLSEILGSPVKKVIILLDPDAYKEALSLGYTLTRVKKIKVVNLGGNKDVNDLGKEKTLKVIKKTPYQKPNELLSELRKLKSSEKISLFTSSL